jgi:hypothetical protein
MRRPFRGDMPIPLTLPLHFDLNLAVRRRRLRRVAVAALAVLGAALLAAGFWLPAKAKPAHDPPIHTLARLAVGDLFSLAHADGTVLDYEVIALDVVDSERAELGPEIDDGIVVLVTRWPLDAARVSGSWRYVVTARRTDAPGLSF